MNFYKITNGGEKHNGLQYKTGLNIDPLPWNPNGNCEKGGIYFAREDILAFLSYGPWIRRVTIPEGTEIYENPGEPKKWKAHKVILGKRERVSVVVIRKLIKQRADIHANNNCALKWASENGHLEIVRLLIKHGAAIDAQNNYALRGASRNGHLEVVKFLVKQGANIHADDDYVLKWASVDGHLETVRFLIKHGANVRATDAWALETATQRKHLEIVKLLIKHGKTQRHETSE